MSEDMRERYADKICETNLVKDETELEWLLDAVMAVHDEATKRAQAEARTLAHTAKLAATERDQLRELTATCTCYDGGPANYEGPRADCPVHGAIRAFNEERAATDRVRAIHRPAGPYCTVCDPVFGAGDGSDGNNPDCTHQPRYCDACRGPVWPCPTRAALDPPGGKT